MSIEKPRLSANTHTVRNENTVLSKQDIVVLKFGGSVLHSKSDFDRIYSEIQRHRNQGVRVIAVVSAYFGVTEQLIAQATSKQFGAESVDYAALIASGEFRSASELVEYLIDQGISASYQPPKDLEFVAHGDRRRATPATINTQRILEALALTPTIVVPGFSAVDAHGECVLLGRGGSDISAVYIAHALGLGSVRLLKDVNGLYDRDPNKYSTATRLEYVDYATACRIGGELIQPEAIDFAATKSMAIDVAAIGSINKSRIGPKLATNLQANVSASHLPRSAQSSTPA